MAQTDDLIQTLKLSLRERGITYALIAEKLELSESSVKRMFSRSTLTLRRLEQVCDVADLAFDELVSRAGETRRDIDQLSEEQEQALVADTKLLLVAFLLLNYRTVQFILDVYEIDELEMIQLLAKLDRMKIIHLLPANQVRMRLSRTFSWRRNGPIERLFEDKMQNEFFQSHFNNPGELRLVLNGMVTEQSLESLHQRMRRLAAEFEDHVRDDRNSLSADPMLHTMVLAVRPWTLKMFASLRRAK